MVKEEDEGNDALAKKALIVFEIIDLMDKHEKSKSWLLTELRKQGSPVLSSEASTKIQILTACKEDSLFNLLRTLKGSKHEFLTKRERKLPESRTYHWFFTDIVHSSDPTLPTDEQAFKIIALNKLIKQTRLFKNTDLKTTFILPTGDGMAIGFIDSPEKPLKLAIQLHEGITIYNEQMLEEEKKLSVRIGLHTGPVYIIKDPVGRENVWGDGIIIARRVMDLAKPMNILASAEFANDVKSLRTEYRNILHILQNYPIKYGSQLIYNIYGDHFGNKDPPSNPIEESTPEQEFEKRPHFIFENVLLEIKITDKQTMMAHHTMSWELVNILNESSDRVFVSLAGDVPKNTIEDIHLVVKDEYNNNLNLQSVTKNKPFEKKLSIRLAHPIEPNQTGRIVKLEWDWEEVDRQYVHEFTSFCKHFNFRLVVPRDLNIEQKVVRIDKTGDHKLSTISPNTEYNSTDTTVTWSASNVPANFVYRFDW